jgi:6-phosphogluconolactonase
VEPALRVYDSPHDVAVALSQRLAGCLSRGGTALLAGGNSPLETYRLLAARAHIPWSRIVLLPTDERVLPEGHPGRNDTALREIFRHRKCRVVGLPLKASPTFEAFLESRMPFAAALLGLGEDGHTASLFPGNAALFAEGLWVPVRGAPKAPAERVSLTFRAFEAAETVLFCVTGKTKRAPLRRLLDGEDLPAGRLRAARAPEIYCDRLSFPD